MAHQCSAVAVCLNYNILYRTASDVGANSVTCKSSSLVAVVLILNLKGNDRVFNVAVADCATVVRVDALNPANQCSTIVSAVNGCAIDIYVLDLQWRDQTKESCALLVLCEQVVDSVTLAIERAAECGRVLCRIANRCPKLVVEVDILIKEDCLTYERTAVVNLLCYPRKLCTAVYGVYLCVGIVCRLANRTVPHLLIVWLFSLCIEEVVIDSHHNLCACSEYVTNDCCEVVTLYRNLCIEVGALDELLTIVYVHHKLHVVLILICEYVVCEECHMSVECLIVSIYILVVRVVTCVVYVVCQRILANTCVVWVLEGGLCILATDNTCHSVELCCVECLVLNLYRCRVNIEVELCKVGSNYAELTIRTLKLYVLGCRVADEKVYRSEVCIGALVVDSVILDCDIAEVIADDMLETEVALCLNCWVVGCALIYEVGKYNETIGAVWNKTNAELNGCVLVNDNHLTLLDRLRTGVARQVVINLQCVTKVYVIPIVVELIAQSCALQVVDSTICAIESILCVVGTICSSTCSTEICRCY